MSTYKNLVNTFQNAKDYLYIHVKFKKVKEEHWDYTASKILNYTKNGMSMFIFQAQIAYESWFGYKPSIEDNLWELLLN